MMTIRVLSILTLIFFASTNGDTGTEELKKELAALRSDFNKEIVTLRSEVKVLSKQVLVLKNELEDKQILATQQMSATISQGHTITSISGNVKISESRNQLPGDPLSLADDECRGITFENCLEQFPINQTTTIDAFHCEQICRLENDCQFVKYDKDSKECKIFQFDYRREECKTISAEKDSDIGKCFEVPALSYENMMQEDCELINTQPTFICEWPNVKSYDICKQHCIDNGAYPPCHFWSHDESQETCRLYTIEMRDCKSIVVPRSTKLTYCTDGDESDGAWSQWTHFSSCSADSGGCKRSRSRICDSPPSTAKGLPCSGHYVEIEDCASDECSNKTLEERVEYLEKISKINTLKSCSEYAYHGVDRPGMYQIDPDGDHGHPPIDVFCDFEAGSTTIFHDHMFVVEIDHCTGPMCYQLDLDYHVPQGQIEALIENSESCSQDLSFNYIVD